MKIANIRLCLLLGGICMLSACFSDDSSLGSAIPEITISDFEETSYTRVSYVGQTLDFVNEPAIETGYAEGDLDYLWTIVPVQKSSSTTEYVQPVEIATSSNLSYPINIAPGDYTVRLQVSSKSNSYSVSKTVQLTVVTQFSQGFYLLKETAEGNSELDLLLADGTHSVDLLSQTREEGVMKGAPLNLSIAYDYSYIDDENNNVASANFICVTTKDREINLFRSFDLKEFFNRSNLLYGGMEEDEKPYAIQFGLWASHYFSSKGVRTNQCHDIGYKGSGKYGMPEVATGGSIYMTRSGMNSYFWDEDGHQFYLCDYNGGVSLVTDAEGMPVDLSEYDCVGAGTNQKSTILFILQSRSTGERSVYQISTRGIISTVYPIDPSSQFAKSQIVRVNGLQANYLYGIVDNKLYGYDWTSGAEKQLPLKGIGDGETINYLSNQFYTASGSFDYLIVGTTKNGSDYNLYFYKMVGGIPDGEPVLHTSGIGRINNVRYVSPSFSYSNALFGIVYPYMD